MERAPAACFNHRMDLIEAARAGQRVTAEHVEQFVARRIPENFSLEYKRELTPRCYEAVAAMANTHGGVILIGVSDANDKQHAPFSILGLPSDARQRFVDMCLGNLEPPFAPSVHEVEVAGQRVLVAYVDEQEFPRPIVIDGKVFVRSEGRNVAADWFRIRALFTEPSPSPLIETAALATRPSQLSMNTWTGDESAFIVSGEAAAPLPPRAGARPLGTVARTELARQLHGSRLLDVLAQWLDEREHPHEFGWRLSGFNSSRASTLELKGVATVRAANGGTHLPPVSARVLLRLPVSPGDLPALRLTVDVVVRPGRRGSFTDENMSRGTTDHPPLSLLEAATLIQAIAGTVWHIASHLMPLVLNVPLLRITGPICHIESVGEVDRVLALQDLWRIDETRRQEGYLATLQPAPGVDLREPSTLREEVKAWLTQMLLDWGYGDVERALAERL